MFKAILWDNDGTLVNTEPLFFKSTEQVLIESGFELDQAWYEEHCLKKGLSAFQVAKNSGISDDQIAKIRDRRNNFYSDYIEQGVVIMPGIVDVLQSLKDKFVMGVVTDSGRDHFTQIMRISGLSEYFDFSITSDDVARCKPNSDGYLKGIELTGFKASECLAIEDTVRGVTAAKSAGLSCYVIPNDMTRNADFSEADKVLDSCKDLLELI